MFGWWDGIWIVSDGNIVGGAVVVGGGCGDNIIIGLAIQFELKRTLTDPVPTRVTMIPSTCCCCC